MADRPPAVLDRFIPAPDHGGRHEITVHAPAALVMDTAKEYDIQSIWFIRAIFHLRALMLGAKSAAEPPRTGLVASMTAIGWGILDEEPGRVLVAGAACQPWKADVVFAAISPGGFLEYAAPDQVKIAWTLEAQPLSVDVTRFATETRVVATDEQARKHFRRYWRTFGAGIIVIRRLLLPALRHRAEQRWRALGASVAAR